MNPSEKRHNVILHRATLNSLSAETPQHCCFSHATICISDSLPSDHVLFKRWPCMVLGLGFYWWAAYTYFCSALLFALFLDLSSYFQCLSPGHDRGGGDAHLTLCSTLEVLWAIAQSFIFSFWCFLVDFHPVCGKSDRQRWMRTAKAMSLPLSSAFGQIVSVGCKAWRTYLFLAICNGYLDKTRQGHGITLLWSQESDIWKKSLYIEGQEFAE